MPERQRAEMCRHALDASSQLDERKLVWDVLKLHPSMAALALAIKTMQVPELKEEATFAENALIILPTLN